MTTSTLSNAVPVGTDSPFRRPGTFGRRAMLAGMGAVGVAAGLGQPLVPTPSAFAAPPKPVGDGSRPSQPMPFSLQASSELSEDYFLTDDVLIGVDDRVLPFTNTKNGGVVEAVVLSGGAVHHLRRDPSTSSGWTYTVIPTTGLGIGGPVTDAAVQVGADGVVVLACIQSVNSQPAIVFYTLGDPEHWNQYRGGAEYLASGGLPLRSAVAPDGLAYFSMATSEGSMTIWTITAAGLQVIPIKSLTGQTVVDAILLWNPDTPSGRRGNALVLTSDNVLSCYAQTGFDSFDPLANFSYDHVDTLVWAGFSPDPTRLDPMFVYKDADGALYYTSQSAGQQVALLEDYGDTPGPGRSAVWRNDDLYAFAFVDEGVVETVTQYGNPATSSTFSDPLPLVTGVERIYALTDDPQEATLFAVNADETLSVLTLDDSGWTQTLVHQDGATLQEVTSYRVKVQVRDANDVGVVNAAIQLSADRPVGLWQPAGSTLVTPAAPVTLTADALGAVTFSMPAEELDAAVLTVWALGPDGERTGSAFLITADTDVRGFLGGTGTLASVGTMSPSVLLSAKNADGTPLLPTLTTLPTDQQQDVAGQAGAALQHFVAVGAGQSPAQVGAAAMQLDVSGSAPAFSTSTDVGAYRSVQMGASVGISFSHLFHSIGHALRHAAVALSKAVVRWVDDAKNWVVDLAIKIGDAVVNFADLVITDMKDAFHVIGGFFQTLGADIKAAIDWLKHNIIDLLKEAGSNAKTVKGWLDQAPGEFTTVVKGIEVDVDNFFTSKENQVHDLISKAATAVEDATFGSSAPLPPPSNDTGSSTSQAGLSKDLSYLGKVVNDAPARWLLDKLLAHLPSDPGPQLNDVFSPVIDDLAKDFTDGVTFAESVLNLILTTAKDSFGSRGQIDQTRMADWFGDLDQTVHDGLQLCDAVADTVLDLGVATLGELGAYLSYEYHLVSKSSIIGLILDAAGIDPTLALDHLLSLVVAFPATLVGRIRGLDSLFPASTAQLKSGRAGVGGPADGWQTGLGVCAAVTQVVWGLADVVGDLQSMVDPDSGERGTQSGLIDYIDIICPILGTIFLWPSKTFADGSTAYPFYGGLATDTKDWGLLPGTIVTALIPSCFGIAAKMKSPTAGTTGGASLPSGVKDPFADYFGPVVNMISGIGNTALSTAYTVENGADGKAIAGTVLGNVSFILAPLATWWMNSTTADVPVLIKTAVDGVGNVGAAICIAESASLPPK
jgi:hypothetical protein